MRTWDGSARLNAPSPFLLTISHLNSCHSPPPTPSLLFCFSFLPAPPPHSPYTATHVKFQAVDRSWEPPDTSFMPNHHGVLTQGKKEIKKPTQTSLHQLEQLKLDCMSALGEDPCLINRGLIQDRNSPQHVNPSGPCNLFFF